MCLWLCICNITDGVHCWLFTFAFFWLFWLRKMPSIHVAHVFVSLKNAACYFSSRSFFHRRCHHRRRCRCCCYCCVPELLFCEHKICRKFSMSFQHYDDVPCLKSNTKCIWCSCGNSTVWRQSPFSLPEILALLRRDLSDFHILLLFYFVRHTERKKEKHIRIESHVVRCRCATYE